MPDNVLDEKIAAELFHRSHARPGDEFVRVLERDGAIIAPGIHNAYGAAAACDAALARQVLAGMPAQHNAVYLGGWSVSAMLLQRPDMGFLERSTMTLVGRYAIPAAFPLPVIVDAETGFGPETVDIADTVVEYDRIKVALAHLEDQKTRRCGNLIGKECEDIETMLAKYLTWLTTTVEIGSSMHLMARTDALTAVGGGIDNAIERMKRYMDVEYKGRRPLVSWADALIHPRDIEKWARELLRHDPNMVLGFNHSPNKDWTAEYAKLGILPPTYADLRQYGFRVIWHTILQARADMEAGRNIMDRVAEVGEQALYEMHERQRGHVYADAQGLSRFRVYEALDKFVGGEATKRRYEQSRGYTGEPEPPTS